MEIRRHKITAEHCPDDVPTKGLFRTPLRTGGWIIDTTRDETAFREDHADIRRWQVYVLTVNQHYSLIVLRVFAFSDDHVDLKYLPYSKRTIDPPKNPQTTKSVKSTNRRHTPVRGH